MLPFFLQQEIQFSMINVIEYVRALKQYEILNVDTLKKNIADLAVLIQKNTEEVSHIEENYPKVEEAAKGTKAIHNVRLVFY